MEEKKEQKPNSNSYWGEFLGIIVVILLNG